MDALITKIQVRTAQVESSVGDWRFNNTDKELNDTENLMSERKRTQIWLRKDQFSRIEDSIRTDTMTLETMSRFERHFGEVVCSSENRLKEVPRGNSIAYVPMDWALLQIDSARSGTNMVST